MNIVFTKTKTKTKTTVARTSSIIVSVILFTTTWMTMTMTMMTPYHPCIAMKNTYIKRKRNGKTLISFPLLHHQHIIARRNRHLEEEDEEEKATLSPPPPWGTIYQGYGTHYVDLWVGTPPQRQTVIIDTGSDITAFPCQECGSNCGKSYHTDDNFIHTNSSSFYKLQCDLKMNGEDDDADGDGGNKEWIEFKEVDDDEFDMCQVGQCSSIRRLNNEAVCAVGVSYAEGSSWDAYEATDIVYLGGSHDMPLESASGSSTSTDDENEKIDEKEERKMTLRREEENNNEHYYSHSHMKDEKKNLRQKVHPSKRILDTNEMDDRIVHTQHNTIELENEFKKEAQIVEDQYLAEHDHSHHDDINEKVEDATDSKTEDVEDEDEDAGENQHQEIIQANDYSFNLSFGCQYKITGLFKTQLADGIMGMEYSNDSFWMQMYNANIIQNRMFALCFTLNDDEITKEGTMGGSMTLGGSDPRLHDSKMVYAQNDTDDGWYTVFITGIYLRRGIDGDNDGDNDGEIDESGSEEVHRKMDETPMYTYYENVEEVEEIGDIVKVDVNIHRLNSRGIIVDSGTTDTYLPSFVHKRFQAAYKKIYGMTLHDAIKTQKPDEIDIQSFPTILIQLKKAKVTSDEDKEMYQDMTMKFDDDDYGMVGSLDERHPDDVMIEIPPHHYLSQDHNKLEERFHINDEDGFGILGANTMFGYDILFDVENDRIGFARSGCDHSVLRN